MTRLLTYFLFLVLPAISFSDNRAFENLWDETLRAYAAFGNEKYMIQEEITQVNHVLQAATIAKLAGAPNPIIVALLFHDIGQVIKEENIGKLDLLHYSHAEVGGEWLQRKRFPPSVVDFVKNHALAKVILCQIDPFYYDHLSEASKISYAIQKKRYDEEPEKVSAFLKHPLHSHFLAARKCDDLAKIIVLSIEKGNLPRFADYFELASSVYREEQEESFSDNWIETVDRWHRLMVASRESCENMLIDLLTRLQ